MAWSANIVVSGNNSMHVAQTFAFAVLEEIVWQTNDLRVRKRSAQIVLASSRRDTWPHIKAGNVVSTIGSTKKCLGYYSSAMVMLRSRKQSVGVVCAVRFQSRLKLALLIARWWRMQINCILGFAGPSLDPTQRLAKDFIVIANRSARWIGKLPNNFNIADRLQMIKHDFSVDVPIMYFNFLVNRVKHVLRHEDWPAFKVSACHVAAGYENIVCKVLDIH